MSEKEYDEISTTALMIADFRARYTNIPYSQEIYNEIKSTKHIMKKSLPIFLKISKLFKGTLERASSIEGRYLSVNDALKKENPDLIIELASGLSPRTLEKQFENKIFLDTDLTNMINTKKKIFKKISKQKPNHKFLEINALDENDWKKLEKLIKNKKQKIAIIHEGLFGYLTKPEQERLRDIISNFLNQHSQKGVWITNDFSVPSKEKSPIIGFARRIIKQKTKRRFSGFKSEQEIDTFLKQANLSRKIIDNYKVIENMSCIKTLNLNKKILKQTSKTYRANIIKLI